MYLCLSLTACLVGPDYKEPANTVASHWLIKGQSIKDSPIQNANWWAVFRDPTLSALIQLGYENNLTLQQAGVRVLRARATLAQSVGNLYPQQQALAGNLTWQRIGGGSLQGILPNDFVTVLVGLSANWEIDFWGKYRRAIRANNAAFLSSFAAYDSALVSLTADLAVTYINIRTIEQLMRVIRKNIQVQSTGLRIAKSRHNAGQTSLLDVEQAETRLYQTKASLPEQAAALQKQKDSLAVLLGTTADKVDCLLGKSTAIPNTPARVAAGIPREALARRPDIYQARLEAIAQSEKIGAIKANLFPSFSLNGTFAFGANNIGDASLGDIFNWSNRIISAGPAFNWPILNYGQITNQVRMQDAVFEESLLKYQELVLKAQQEVQDNITDLIESGKAKSNLEIANRAARTATRLALIRYKEGESDYTPVLDSLTQQLQVERELTTAKGDMPKALVALFRSLGGGWQIRGCNDIVPDSIKAAMAARTNWGSLLKTQNHRPAANKKAEIRQLYLPNW